MTLEPFSVTFLVFESGEGTWLNLTHASIASSLLLRGATFVLEAAGYCLVEDDPIRCYPTGKYLSSPGGVPCLRWCTWLGSRHVGQAGIDPSRTGRILAAWISVVSRHWNVGQWLAGQSKQPSSQATTCRLGLDD